MNRNIILVGFMGTGKSTVGRILAHRLNMKFVDMDWLIEKRIGKSISRIFLEDGELYFRHIECLLVQELSRIKKQIIATGGGVVLNPDNIINFSRTGKVICLSASEQEIMCRISSSSSRPLLEKDNKFQQIFALFENRRPLYNAIPTRIDTSQITPEEVAKTIISIINTE